MTQLARERRSIRAALTRPTLAPALALALLASGALPAGAAAATGATASGAGAQPSGAVRTAAVQAPSLTSLKVEHKVDPIGIDVAAPRLSWVIESAERGTVQESYRVRVAPATAPDAPVWDSGVVASAESAAVDYDGGALTSATDYVWSVDVVTSTGAASARARFRTGLLDDADWQGAAWIGNERDRTLDLSLTGSSWIWTPEATSPVAPGEDRAFRRVIASPAGTSPVRAEIVITADDSYSLAVDGRSVASSSGATNDWQNARYHQVQLSGDDVLVAVRTTNGAGSPAGLVAVVRVHYADGSTQLVRTGADWRSTKTVPDAWAALSLDDADWAASQVIGTLGQGPWGGQVRAPQPPVAPAPLLRREFEVRGEVRSATAYYAAGGYADLSLDGEPVNDDVLSPGFSDYDDTVQYAAIDLTDQLSPGTHSMGIELGRGFYGMTGANVWRWERAPWHDEPVVRAVVEIEYADGTTDHLVTDDSWTIHDGPTVFDDLYAGEVYDAALEQDGWNTVGFDDDAWAGASEVAGPRGELVNQRQQPIRISEELPAVDVTEAAAGTWVVKFPRVIAGWVEVTASGPAGTEIRYAHGEKLHANGRVNMSNNGGFASGFQTDTFRLAGTGGPETFEPSFSYKGFQYLEVTGWPGGGAPPKEAFTAKVLHTDAERTGSVETSSSIVNRTHEATVATIYNNIHHIPTDTPMFEKNGWTGDAAVGAEMFLLNTDTHELFAKWLRDLHETRTDDGAPMVIAPSSGDWGDWGAAQPWHSAYVMIPEWLRVYSGDDRTLRDLYDGMAAYVEFELGRSDDGLVTDNRLADWVSPEASPAGGNAPEDSRVSGTAYLYAMLRSMEASATHLGLADDAAGFADDAEVVAAAFERAFYDADRGHYRGNGDRGYRQTHNVLALAFGLVPAEREQQVADSIAADVRAKGVHLNTGVLGTKYLLPVLSDHGHADLAYDLAVQTTYPSWGFKVENGATTMWEHWAEDARSRGHYFLGTVEDWYYQYVGGIKPSPVTGYRDLRIAPVIGDELTHAAVESATPYGPVSSRWSTEEGDLSLAVSVPVGATATVVVPADSPLEVLEGGAALDDAEGVASVQRTDDGVEVVVGSGDYDFAVDSDLAPFGAVLTLLDELEHSAEGHHGAGDLSDAVLAAVREGAAQVAAPVGAAADAVREQDDAAVAAGLDTALERARALAGSLREADADRPVRGDLAAHADRVVAALEQLASQRLGVSVSIDPLAEPALPGDRVRGTVTVVNTGTRTLSDARAAVRVGEWEVTGPETGPARLAPGESETLAFTVAVPGTAPAGDVEALVELAYTLDGVERTARESAVWTVLGPRVALEDVRVAMGQDGAPGQREAAAASARLVNDGSLPVTGRLELVAPSGWARPLPSAPITVPAGGSVEATLPFWVPRQVAALEHRLELRFVRGGQAVAVGAATLTVELATPPAEAEGVIDHVDLGDDASERAHALEASPSSGTSSEAGLTRRYAHSQFPGSWYSVLVDVPAGEPFVVRMRETFDQAVTKEFNLYVDDVLSQRHTLTKATGGVGWIAHQVTVDDPAVLAQTADGRARLKFEFPVDAGGYDPSIADVWVLPATADTAAPLTSLEVTSAVPGLDGWHRAPVTATVLAQDDRPGDLAVEVAREGGWTPYEGPIALTDDGVHPLSVRARDGAGNRSSSTEHEIRIDATAPVTEIATRALAPDRAAIELRATDATSGVAVTHYRVDGGAWAEHDGASIVVEGAGEHRIEFRSVDRAGNVEALRTARLELSDPGPGEIPMITAPQVLGTARVGQELRSTSGSWGTGGVSLQRQWLRDGRAIKGATGTRYRLRAADATHRISLRVSARKAGHRTLVLETAATPRVERARSSVALRAPAEVRGATATVRLRVYSEAGTAGGLVSLRVNGRAVRTVRLQDGAALASVPLSRVGLNRVEAHYAGSAGVEAARSAAVSVQRRR